MPNRSKRPCKRPACLNLTDRKDGYCEQHVGWSNKVYKQCRTDTAEQRFYRSMQWLKLRTLKMQRAPLCEVCLEVGRIKPAEIVHHKLPIKQGGDALDMDNLQSICTSCHNKADAHRTP